MTIVEIKPEASQSSTAKPDAATLPASAAMPDTTADETIAHTAAEIIAGAKDSGGEKVDCVYFKRTSYAIYRRGAPPQVVVAYAEDQSIADQQIAAIGPLLPMRDHLLNLIFDLPVKSQETCHAQIADALRLGLEKQSSSAQALLTEATNEALAAQGRRGRLVYLQWTGLAILPALFLIVFGGYFVPDKAGVNLLLMSAGAGVIGAVLSIAIGIRARTVAIEGDWKSNAVDAAVRVTIGMISAAVLFLMLHSGVVTNISAGDAQLSGSAMDWQVALIIGFAAGFLERLVPDLLEKTAPPSKSTFSTPAAGAGGVAPPS
jgi:hypothetical protein